MKKILTAIACFFTWILSAHAQILYSMTSEGGTHGLGVIFTYDPSSSTYTKLHDFDSTSGSYPYGKLMRASNGKLYGMTTRGGSSDDGIIFSFDPASSAFTKLVDFDYNPLGAIPVGNLVEAPNGKLYGMTSQGGTLGSGVIFSFDPSSSTYTKLLDFDNDNGNAPTGSFIIGSDGKLYGMTGYGGLGAFGVIFSFDPSSSTYTKLKNFDYYNNGGHPVGSLLQAKDGKLYGMTYDGGSSQFGVIFSFDLSTSIYTNLKDFEYNDTNLINGAYPFGSLIQATNGKLYGMTPDGGSSGDGVIFSVDPSTAVFTKLEDFDNVNGSHPYGDLIQGGDGKLYGMTYLGGSAVNNNNGIIFSFDPLNAVFTKLKDFSGPEGARPNTGSGFITLPEAGPVPVTLISFTGKNNGNSNRLTWNVANEFLSYYELQRGTDGQRFKDVAQIKATGNNSYGYDDAIAAAASSLYYYRLKSVDRDGKFKYSPVLQIKREIKEFTITINPNPFKDRLIINVEALTTGKAIFILTDLNGKHLYKLDRLLSSGTSVIEIDEAARLSKGTYLLTIIASQKTQSIRVVKGG